MATHYLAALLALIVIFGNQPQQSSATVWKVEVHTADDLWAGTDTDVLIRFKHGTELSDFIELDNDENNFERDDLDEFEDIDDGMEGTVSAIDIHIKYDFWGLHAWKLDWVLLTDNDSGNKYCFKFDHWFKVKLEDEERTPTSLSNCGVSDE